MPFFSIVIPLYNKENFITKTINSTLNQTFEDFEIIVVNDGSTDDSANKVEAINDKRVTLYTIKNQGVSHARNYGINKAKTDYICFLDADDFWYNNHLEQLNTLLQEHPDCGLYASAYQQKIGKTLIESVYKDIPKQENWSGIVDDYFKSSLVNSIAWTSAVMVPKHIFDTIGLFDENITLGAGEDTDLWIRIALKHPVAFSNTVTAIHNLDAENRITNSNTNLRQFLDLDKYEADTKEHEYLKHYLDLNRYSIGLQYKLAGNSKKAKDYFNKIDENNLNSKQKTLIKSNVFVLKVLMNSQRQLRRFNINLTAFK